MKLTRHQFVSTFCAAAAGVSFGGCDQPSGQNAGEQAARQPVEAEGEFSFAQSGEDLIANFIFKYLDIPKITYLDVGAWDPVEVNNTYYFYRRGFRGVLVEPNVERRGVQPRHAIVQSCRPHHIPAQRPRVAGLHRVHATCTGAARQDAQDAEARAQIQHRVTRLDHPVERCGVLLQTSAGVGEAERVKLQQVRRQHASDDTLRVRHGSHRRLRG